MGVSEGLKNGLKLVRGVQAAARPTASTHQLPTVSARDASGPPTEPAPANSGSPSGPPTAFVSWAHSHPTWSVDRTSDWESQVAAFVALLRYRGIEAEVDLFHLDEAIDWTRYGPREIEVAQYTLIVMSRAWAERWSGANQPHEGAGAAAEADTLKGLFTRDQEVWQRRVVIVMFPDVEQSAVPLDLQRVSRVSVDPSVPDSYEQLIRILTEQPRYPKPPLGEVPVFDPAAGYEESSALIGLRDRLAQIERRKKQLANRVGRAASDELEKLDLSEAVTRGQIDTELALGE